MLQVAEALQQVRTVDTGGVNLYQHLAAPGFRQRAFGHGQHVGATRASNLHRSHHVR
jgi:hypothetical protein